jgi:GTP-binding protein HflX
MRREMPIVSIVGYTNAGKSTLLNALTSSRVTAEQRMFATLDPTSRRLRLPHDQEVIINDTVGFIRDLPKDLLAAFKATLEEVEQSDLLIHLVDASSPQWLQSVASVYRILGDLALTTFREFWPSIRWIWPTLRSSGTVAVCLMGFQLRLRTSVAWRAGHSDRRSP